MIDLIYRQMCPGCGGDIESERLYEGLLCKKCMPKPTDPCEVKSQFLRVCELFEKEDAFAKHFEKAVGFAPRQLQRSWAKRFFLDRSFALLAPTGIGKTTFGLALSSFLIPKKSYLIFPTQLLVQEAQKRLQTMGYEPLVYHSRISKKDRIKERIFEGDFTILITTTNFLYKNFESIPKEFDLVFVDDVDSVLKSARNIDKVLMLLGFESDDIETALKFIDYKRQMAQKGEFDEKKWQWWQKKMDKIRSKKRGNLIVSSATANPRSRRVHLFRELLGFEVGRPSVSLRNIEDVYEEPEVLYDTAVERIRSFGKGGLVFLPGNKTKEELHEFVAFLQTRGIAAQSYEEFDEEAFRSGKIEAVVGFASYRNPLARGLDMPDTIRYALFVGVPKMEFRLDLENHVALYYFMLAIKKALPQVNEWIGYLERLRFIPPQSLLPEVKEKIEDIRTRLLELLRQHEKEINDDPHISLIKDDESYKVITADVTGYIQASGRTSRLYAGGLTKGLAYTLVDSRKAFVSLQKKVRWFSEDIVFRPREEVDLDAIFRRIDEDRKKIKEALEGKISDIDPFVTTLVVVESPNKARTIAGFYGKPMVRNIGGVRVYEVAKEDRMLSIAASKGHLFDLSTDVGFDGVLVEPHFIEVFEPIDEDRYTIVQVLRELDIEDKEVFIATDPDTEGEKISYDIYLNSLPFNKRIQRAEFHEVTKRAFDEALKNPRDFDEDLVRAQLVRRVADRWIGFEVSKYLQKRFGRKSLSAGRVQSAVLEWIVLREYEATEQVWVVKVDVGAEAEFVFEDEKEAKEFYEALEKVAIKFTAKEPKKLFETPFSTDRMLYAASRKLRFSPQKTMELAQDLFEGGFITYHRTDSIRVSSAGIAIAKEYISERFGEEYFVPRSFASSGGAHEAIRPTRPMDREDLEEFLQLSNRSDIHEEHLKLYDLIFRTFIASQMKEAVVEEIEAAIEALGKEVRVRFFSRILEHGIDLVMPVETKKIQEGRVEAKKELLQRPKVPRYTYAEVIRMMKERGVGRPSTYAITIEKLQSRRYIYQKGGVLYATKLGIEVYEELRKNPAIYAFVNERYTKELEDLMDRVEQGELAFDEVLKELYEKIQKEIHENNI